MNKEIKKEWVKRLRSGKYEQGKYYLSAGGCHCCLGVLCEIATEQKIIKKFSVKEESGLADSFGEDEDSTLSALPTHKVIEWAGLNVNFGGVPFVSVHDVETELTELNDKLDYSFKQIADLVEAQL